MTGDTAKGKSMSVMRRLLPRKLNLAIAHAAATPNTRFAGTAIAAAVSVSLMALIASGSVNAWKNGPNPLRSASVNTAASGSRRKQATNAKAIVMKVTRTHTGLRITRGPTARSGPGLAAREEETPAAM